MSNILTVTERAIARVEALVSTKGSSAIGIRIGVRQLGCSDMSYTMDFAEAVREEDVVIETGKATVLVDPAATPYIKGSELDWLEEKLQSRFVFNNPNVVGQCGCGESFKIS